MANKEIVLFNKYYEAYDRSHCAIMIKVNSKFKKAKVGQIVSICPDDNFKITRKTELQVFAVKI